MHPARRRRWGHGVLSAVNRYARRRGIKGGIAVNQGQQTDRRNRGSAGGRPPAFDPAQYRVATPSSTTSASSRTTAQPPPVVTSANSSSTAPSTSPRSGSGATRHVIQETAPSAMTTNVHQVGRL